MLGILAIASFLFSFTPPGHAVGVFVYNAAPKLFRTSIAFLHSRNSQGQLQSDEFWTEVRNHISVTAMAIGAAMAICLPLGVLAARVRWFRTVATNITGIARGIPGVAVLFLMWPYLGNGERPALVALTILAAPPILLNTIAGFATVDAAIVEAARGMGMSPLGALLRIETPLAAPVLIAGIRTAAVEVIASATIASYINFDTLGSQISAGIAFPLPPGPSQLAIGVTAVATMALIAEMALTGFQWAVRTPGR
jgi:osmoprotectant transport system permease protein